MDSFLEVFNLSVGHLERVRAFITYCPSQDIPDGRICPDSETRINLLLDSAEVKSHYASDGGSSSAA